VDDLATLDGRENGIALHDGNDTEAGSFGRPPTPYRELCGTGRRGRETDMWGPRVRNFFYLNSNFRIVTQSYSKRKALISSKLKAEMF
jgi:hypothetical protein